MKRSVLLTATMISFLFSFSLVFSGEKKSGTKEPDVWKAYDRKGEVIGTIKKEKERYIFYDKDEIELKATEKNIWEMYNQEGDLVGTLKKDKNYYVCYDKQEKKVGVILESKAMLPWRSMQRSTKVTPEMAELYLHVLEALEKIK